MLKIRIFKKFNGYNNCVFDNLFNTQLRINNAVKQKQSNRQFNRYRGAFVYAALQFYFTAVRFHNPFTDR